MCGIWALLSQAKIDQYGKLFESFMKLKNRGPEYSSFDLINDHTLLGFHRLAIMDLSAEGNQPFKYVRKDGSCTYCACNGEIYDYKKLKQEYNIITKSNSDCEVIIPLYEKLGVDKMVRLLGSEFAFTILDVSKDGHVKMVVGRDPIGVRPLFYSINENSLCVSSELKGLSDIYEKCYVFPPGHYMVYENEKMEMTQYYMYEYKELSPVPSIAQIYVEIRRRLINCVRKRMMTDRNFGMLVSGGLDSSLICGIVRYLIDIEFTELQDTKIPVFSIGLKTGSTDLPYAKQVAEYLGFDHHVIEISEEDALSVIPDVIRSCETFDITSVRASCWQYMLAKYVKENTDVRVLFCGENADENWEGYSMFHHAPTAAEGRAEAINLVKNVHRYDGLRADRSMANFGLEIRLAFADPEIVDYVFSLPPELTMPQNGLEKALLRNAFRDMKLIPDTVNQRRKDAMSDAVSELNRSWYQIIQEHIDKIITDEEFLSEKDKFKHCAPYTKESYYYRKKFVEYFGDSEETAQVIPYFWLHKWVNTNDPSARTIKTLEE